MPTRRDFRLRLARLEKVTNKVLLLDRNPPAPPADDGSAFASQLEHTFRRLIDGCIRSGATSGTEAAEHITSALTALEAQTIHGSPSEVSWLGLTGLARRDPKRALQRWQEIRQAARDAVSSGQQAMLAVEDFGSQCWSRAVFLAVRDELIEAWRPRNGQEQQLVDLLAQSQVMIWAWQQALTAHSWASLRSAQRAAEEDRRDQSRSFSHAEQAAEAMETVERWHSIYLKTVKTLQSLQRV